MKRSDWLAHFEATQIPRLNLRKQQGLLIEQSYCVAGKNVEVRYSCTALAEALGSSLRHLESDPNRPADLEIFVWDRSESAPAAPAPPEPRDVAHRSERYHYHCSTGAISIYDSAHRQGYYWVDGLAGMEAGLRAKPFRNLLHWFLIPEGITVVHGAVVADAHSGVLLMARGGAGKTTTSLACVNGGLFYLADDFAAVDSRCARAYSLYSSALLTSECRRQMPEFAAFIKNPDRLSGEKGLISLHETHPGQLRRETRLKAILIPEVGHRDTTSLQPIAPGIALLRMSPASIGCFPGYQQQQLTALRNLVVQLPCFVLSLGRNGREIASTIQSFLKTAPV